MPYSVHLQLEYRKIKDKTRERIRRAKAGLHALIALIPSALALLEETKQRLILICYQEFKREQTNITLFSIS